LLRHLALEAPLLNAEKHPLYIAIEQTVKLCFIHLAEWTVFRHARIREHDIELSLLLLDLLEESVEIGHIGYIALDASDFFSNLLDCFVNSLLATASDMYMRAFGYEQLCCCQADSAGTTCDQRYFPV
jgi:hypothetical protein